MALPTVKPGAIYADYTHGLHAPAFYRPCNRCQFLQGPFNALAAAQDAALCDICSLHPITPNPLAQETSGKEHATDAAQFWAYIFKSLNQE